VSVRVQKSDKKLINGKSDLNQIVPIKYQWAWKKYLTAQANTWFPQEVNMGKDVDQWKKSSTFTNQEREIIKRSLGFFSTADSLVSNNIVFSIYKRVTSPECRAFLLRQAWEEVNHVGSYLHIVQSLGMDESEIFNMYHEIDSVSAKASFMFNHTKALEDETLSDEEFLKNLIVYYIVMEGLFFYVGFVQLLAFAKTNRLPGTVEQIKWIMKDEALHVAFGVDLINGIKEENPGIWTDKLQGEVQDLILEGLRLEIAYAKDTMPTGMLGLNSSSFEQYLKYMTNRRFIQIGLPRLYSDVSNPFPWLSELVDLNSEQNFFERSVTEYQTGTLEW
jgi:ribonucleoside-diphosphate reductase beta chain